MSTHKHIDRICIAALIFSIIISLLYTGEITGGVITPVAAAYKYEEKLFDTSKVHEIAIEMDKWDEFIESCENEEYANCNLTIDGEKYKNIAIRAKGNTSLSSVSSMGSQRYSFKIEFDHNDSNVTYNGLDKLALNNVIQDNTYMKDYIVYNMMRESGVASPLCSFVWITVNGEDWGLYLAVESVEDSFLKRNYGNDTGDLYKPDTLSFGGGRGNGQGFDMGDFDFSQFGENSDSDESSSAGGMDFSDFDPSNFGGNAPEGMDFSNSDPSSFGGDENSEGGTGGFGGFGMGSNDVKLAYTDDDPDSYSNIFSSAKTPVTEADKKRLISSLKSLSEYTDLEDVLDTESVLRYMAAHIFINNGDSYTGNMIHNYYLHEKDGQLDMIPWDYNLAYGTFMGGDASSAVNDPVDDVLDDRPMQAWIFSDEKYTELYHQYMAELISSNNWDEIVDTTAELIAPYVEKDPTAFCTYEEFEAGIESIKMFLNLRSESVLGQINGTIPSTSALQKGSSALTDTSLLTLSDMGTMGGAGGFGGMKPPDGMEMPDGFAPSGFSDGNMPEGFDPSGFDGGSMPNGFGDGQNNNSSDSSAETMSSEQNSDSGNSSSSRGERGGRGNMKPGEMPGGMSFGGGTASQTNPVTTLILLGVSVVFLAGGLIFASKYKR